MKLYEGKVYNGDGRHVIVEEVKLNGGGVLHRFHNASGIAYSAIYIGDFEVYSNVREREDFMIQQFNSHPDEFWRSRYAES